MRTCFLETHLPPTWKRRAFFLRARIVRPGSPNWCVAACLTLVPTAKPVASDFDLMELRSCADWMSVFPPSVSALMDVFHRLPLGSLLFLKRSRVDSRTPSARAALMLFLSISEKLLIFRSIAWVSPSSRMLYMAHIPFILSRLKIRGFDFTENPVAAAVVGSSVSAPSETFPSATSVRNLIA